MLRCRGGALSLRMTSSMNCLNCGFESLVGMKYCGQCGASLTLACPQCSFANPINYRFCGMCGTQLAGMPAAEQPTQPLWTIKSASTATFLDIFGKPDLHAKPLQGERRVATVILADVRSSTDLMEQIGSEAWVDIMNHVFRIMEAEIYRFGGEVDQFRGDGLVAFFGARLAHEDDPERAVLAALYMQQAVQTYAEQLAEQRKIDLKLRVGVNTGEVIVASVGESSQHWEDTAMGEAVAIAARMETAAEPGTVLVSETTYRLVEGKFKWQSLGEMTAKGLSRPIATYRPLSPILDADRTHDLQSQELTPPLIGRINQFSTLVQSIEDLQNGRGGIVFVTGEKGMGKSYLVAQVRQHFTRQGVLQDENDGPCIQSDTKTGEAAAPVVAWLRGTCHSYNQAYPYSVWVDLLQNWLGVQHSLERSDETRLRLRREAERLWGDQVELFYPYLASLLTLPLEDSMVERVKHLGAEGLQRQIFLAVRNWVESLAKRSPFLLIFGDMHWADTASLNLLKYCLPLCDSEPIVFLAVFRPDRTSPVWSFNHYVETEFPHRLIDIELPALNELESRELIAQMIGPKTLSAETSALVIKKVEGNPYFIKEILQSLISQGAVAQDPKSGLWRETRQVTTLDLPGSLQSLLLERIDRLSIEERRTLQAAAVIGPVFWRNVLQTLLGDNNHLQASLTGLQRAQFVHERSQLPELGMEYSFTSSLVRDIAYESLLSSQRTGYHLQTAEQLEELFSEDALEKHGGLIAYHYRRGGNPNKELFYTLQAAEQARKVYANAEAIRHYTRALELLDRLESGVSRKERLYAIHSQRFEVLIGRSELLYLQGDIEAGRADGRALLPLARQMADDPAWLIDALLVQPEITSPENQGELDQGLAMAEEALSLAEKLGDPHRTINSLIQLTGLLAFRKDRRWEETGERALQLVRQLGDQRLEALILLGIGSAYGMDNLERSKQYLEAALPICQKLDDRQTEMNLLFALSAQLERNGDYYHQMVDCEQKRRRIAQKVGDRLTEGHASMFCGQIQSLYLGDYEAGLVLLKESLHLWENTSGRLFPMLRIAQIQVELGRYDQAQETLEQCRSVGKRVIETLGAAGTCLVTAILCNAIGDQAHLRQVLELAPQINELVAGNQLSQQYQMAAACESAAAHLGLARFLADSQESQTKYQAHLAQALELSLTAVDIFDRFGFVQIIECTSEEIFFRRSLALAANGHHAQAQVNLQKAYREMLRKHHLIPAESNFRHSYLENIRLHRVIRSAYAAEFAKGE